MCHKGPLTMTQVAEKCRVRNMVLWVYFYGRKEQSLYLRKFWDNKLYNSQKNIFYVSTDMWDQTLPLYYIASVKRSTLLKTVWWISEYDFPKLLVNPLNTELYPICHLLALLGAHHILHVSRIKANGFSMTPATSLLMLIYFITQCLIIRMVLW